MNQLSRACVCKEAKAVTFTNVVTLDTAKAVESAGARLVVDRQTEGFACE